MDQLTQHKNLEETWKNQSLTYQMANIGSEVSRAFKNQDKPTRFEGAFNRALELFDFSIDAARERQDTGALRELCRAREEFCDYFNGNAYCSDPAKIQKYYDDFATLR